ncbi:hypothetical protein SKAU_G00349130 [Synaphobranchus kaupii]|uniref:Uncharacterized protein n=1 Tax=Synaphobranchus kaupii TaxID=118154 RepID=A0A9Q1EK57_SYNKA|nr:hypothetical protein SKAU_G00349130 [Synaphobranchus kaupii]
MRGQRGDSAGAATAAPEDGRGRGQRGAVTTRPSTQQVPGSDTLESRKPPEGRSRETRGGGNSSPSATKRGRTPPRARSGYSCDQVHEETTSRKKTSLPAFELLYDSSQTAQWVPSTGSCEIRFVTSVRDETPTLNGILLDGALRDSPALPVPGAFSKARDVLIHRAALDKPRKLEIYDRAAQQHLVQRGKTAWL